MLGTFLFLTYFFQGTLHYSALKTGFAFLPFSGGIIIGAGLASRLLPAYRSPGPDGRRADAGRRWAACGSRDWPCTARTSRTSSRPRSSSVSAWGWRSSP